MRLNVSAWAIRKPIPSIVLFIVLMILGVFSFQSLPITRFPNIDLPIVSITVTQAGAAPSELQNQVTKRVEDAVAGVNGVKHIISTIAGRRLDHHDRVPAGDQLATAPSTTSRTRSPRSAPTCRAPSTSRSSSASTSPACRSSPTRPPRRR